MRNGASIKPTATDKSVATTTAESSTAGITVVERARDALPGAGNPKAARTGTATRSMRRESAAIKHKDDRASMITKLQQLALARQRRQPTGHMPLPSSPQGYARL